MNRAATAVLPSPSCYPEPTLEQRRRLCAAVSDVRRAIVISEDNTAAGWAAVEDSLTHDRCFAVVPRRDIVALDADSPGAVATLDHIVAVLRLRHVEAVLLASGGPDRRHLFARVTDPQLREQVCELATRGGVDVRGQSPIRPPGTRHRSGAAPQLLSPASWDEAIAVLQPHDAPPILLGNINPRLATLIRDGDVDGRYRKADGTTDGSALVLTICNLAVAEGLSRDQVWSWLSDSRHRGGVALQKRRQERRGRRDASWWFDLLWRRAHDNNVRRAPRQNDPGRLEAIVDVGRILELFDAQPHPGQTGSSDVAVFHALVHLAITSGSLCTPASVRELALRSGKAVATVRGSLGRLRAAGWCSPVMIAHLDRATVWQVTYPADLNSDTAARSAGTANGTTAAISVTSNRHSTVPTAAVTARNTSTGPSRGRGGRRSELSLRVGPGHDAFAHGALGTGAWRVLAALDSDETCTARDLAERTGFHPGSVRRHLVRLDAAGLVSHDDDGGWRRRHDAAAEKEQRQILNHVAVTAGTSGRHARRRAQFEAERQALRRFLVEGDPLVVARFRAQMRQRSQRLAGQMRVVGYVAQPRAA